MSNNRVVLWVCFSQFESLLWQSVREHRAIGSMKKREGRREVLVIYWLMGIKKGIPLYPNLVNLKSNTMKNTVQR